MTSASPSGGFASRVLRWFAFYGGACSLLFIPLFVTKLGTKTAQPIPLQRGLAADGSVSVPAAAPGAGGLVRVTEVRIGAGPRASFVPPGSVAVQRNVRYLAAGTPVTYRGVDAAGTPREVSGIVTTIPAPPGDVARDLVLEVLALSLALAGLALGIAALDRRTLLSAALLSGLAMLSSGYPFQATMSSIADARWRDVAMLVGSAPERFALFFVVAFAAEFPLYFRGRTLARFLCRGIFVLTAFDSLLFFLMPFDPLANAPSIGAQVAWVKTATALDVLLYVLASAAALTLGVQQARETARSALPRDERRRARLLGLSLVVGAGIPMASSVVQSGHILLTGRFLFSPLAMSFLLLPFALVPAAFVYASLARRVESARLLARRALLFAVADRTVRVVSVVPLAALGFFLWTNRDRPLRDLMALQPFTLVLIAAGALFALRYSGRIREAIERAFFRERQDARRILSELATSSRRATDWNALVRELVEKVDAAFHPESVALLVRDTPSGTYQGLDENARPLDAGSTLARLLDGAFAPLRLEPGSAVLASLSETDRRWLEAGNVHLMAPLHDSDGNLLGILSLGEKRSEMPYDAEDALMLSAVTASAALALENRLLRSTPSAGSLRAEAPAPEPEEPAERAAFSCPRCLRLFPKTVGRVCPGDGATLVDETVPYLLGGKFRFEKRIGAGGMGLVYQAYDLALGRPVAIKTLPRVSAEHAARLRREARAAAAIQHPNIALIYGAEQWNGVPMLIFEFVDGGTLARRIRGPVLPVGDVVGWGLAIVSALGAAHGAGVLHRDIKPSNIGFTAAGVPKLLDFGLARILGDPRREGGLGSPPGVVDSGESTAESRLTGSNIVIGTVAYVSPEAAHGEPPTELFDLWALALTVYEALTRTNPFIELTPQATMQSVLSLPLPDPRVYRADCPPKLSRFLLRALSKEPGERPRTADAFRMELSEAGGRP